MCEKPTEEEINGQGHSYAPIPLYHQYLSTLTPVVGDNEWQNVIHVITTLLTQPYSSYYSFV